MKDRDTVDVVKGAFAGLIGGLAGAFVMTQFQTLLTVIAEEVEKPKKKSGNEEEPSTVKVAAEISETIFDHKLLKREKELAGEAVHYAMGATSGLIYGVAAEVDPIASVGVGLPFGAAVWVIADDVVIPALGFSKPVTEYPVTTHAYALSSHLVYGLTTDMVRRFVRKLIN